MGQLDMGRGKLAKKIDQVAKGPLGPRAHAGFSRHGFRFDSETLIATALMCGAVVIGLATVGDYGISVDEWNADDYGPKGLAWYLSGFSDRAIFDDVENTLWYYGPWFHMLTAFVQSFEIGEYWTVRHAMTFLAGLAGIAMLLPLANLAIGRWSGIAAIVLCLTTGYLYGSIFFTPVDVPFLFAMTAATLAIVVMAQRTVPSWPATISAGLLTGLAIATRSSGIITHAYLVGAMALCALEAMLSDRRLASRALVQIGLRTLVAMLFGWLCAIALWPWLQIANPFTQFTAAFVYFANHPASWEFMHWGNIVRTNNLPWSYVPAQLAARLPEGFLLLLVVGLLFGLVNALRIVAGCGQAFTSRSMERLKPTALFVAQSRQALIVWAAALLPVAFVMVQGSTLYDGIRHVLFLIPILAVIASYGFVQLLPFLQRVPMAAAAAIGGYIGYQLYLLAALHPLEYVAFNFFAGGVHGAYQRFDMDYWAAGATVALRRLEDRLDLEAPSRFKDDPPSLMICIAWREDMVESMYRRPWRLETDPDKADYVITTQHMNCAENRHLVLIDEVRRFDRAFAWTYAHQSQDAVGPSETPPQRLKALAH
jgi:hypothetical protein